MRTALARSLRPLTGTWRSFGCERRTKPANRTLVALCCTSAVLLGIPFARAADDPQAAEFFEKQIRPVLANRCFECHGPAKQEAGLRLDTRAGLLAGGDSGPAVVPGEPDASLLVDAIRYGQIFQMPPTGRLPAEEVELLVKWVAQGAIWPGAEETGPVVVRHHGLEITDADRQFWAYVPPRDVSPPAVQNAAWAQTDLDRFILARLEAAGLSPAPPADKRTLLRRVTYDLTGLPPTPEETAAFLADEAPGAFERVVERLLASPHYGERWGRHWLDVVRYADSNGLDENVAFGNAWRYRDYVVAAFNADKPIDRFILEQLAGDLLLAADEAARYEQLIATGFLVLGPKVLAEVDETKMEMDIIDEQIDTLGRSLLAQTFGCVRCHDHKFDPFTQADYYALAGIFRSTRTMETFTKLARWFEHPIPTADELAAKTEYDRLVAEQQTALDQFVAMADAALQAAGQTTATPEERAALYPEETRTELKRLQDALAELQTKAPELSTAMGACEGTVVDCAIQIRGNHLNLGAVSPRRFPQVLALENEQPLPADQSGRLQLAQWLTKPSHPLTARVFVNRVWRWHFGEGLVPTPDNFGRTGEMPTHPELLDWLAVRFVESGWSLKALHRLILRSATYQQCAVSNEAALAVDPDNRLYWRMTPRRLEAEEIRDALLAVSGLLDRTLGGSYLHVKNREYLFDHTSIDKTRYDIPRRTMYLPVIRNHLYDVLQLFDAPDATTPSGDRATTTIAPQALFMLNSDVALQASAALGAQLLALPEQPARVTRLYELALARPPSDEERQSADLLLGQFAQLQAPETRDTAEGEQMRWAWLAQTVLMTNEFVYLR